MSENNAFERLLEIMKRLLDPDGCPWDREQTHESLKPYFLEEVYEFFEALEKKDFENMKEELGDILLQIVFHAELSERAGSFNIHDVLEGVCRKLVHRHPHVFGEIKVKDSSEVLSNWEEIKKKEKSLKDRKKKSVLDGVPKTMPSLALSTRIQERAANVGFDWSRIEDVWGKVHEEINELLEAQKLEDPEKIEEEFGDLLFSLVNLSRFLKVNPEHALRKTVFKFDHRFRIIEKKAEEMGKSLSDMDLMEMDDIWNETKKKDI
ncbi:nucleoside triphosphate pyrophosphohydrolase [Candidatus Sumerlaeota bacterium]|nr:nucleoside triphosphate pyrophosphohydrolase [Candidatus Sumerlaeota bacterium]